jgi:hypothetical protein
MGRWCRPSKYLTKLLSVRQQTVSGAGPFPMPGQIVSPPAPPLGNAILAWLSPLPPIAVAHASPPHTKRRDKWDTRALRLVEPTARRERVPTEWTRSRARQLRSLENRELHSFCPRMNSLIARLLWRALSSIDVKKRTSIRRRVVRPHSPKDRRRPILMAVAVAVLAGIALWAAHRWLPDRTGSLAVESAGDPDSARFRTEDPRASASATVMYCATCHTLPDPGILPKERWPQQVRHMNAVIARNHLGETLSPDQLEQITAYYVQRAPEHIPLNARDGLPSPLRFSVQRFGGRGIEMDETRAPKIGHIRIVDLDLNGRPDVLISDIGNQRLTWAPNPSDGREHFLAEITAPTRVAVADFNGDAHLDIVVADAGSIQPTDDLVGRVILLINDGQTRFTARTLLSGIPRVTDVQAVDLDGDGLPDVLAAAFGLYTTGKIFWLKQSPAGTFEPHVIYKRNGVSQVSVIDLNEDGLPDFIALISQQHEEVVAFINLGGGKFREHLLYKAPHPMWGLSGMELVDLDGDGDLDVLLANGDALDLDRLPKPYHGVRWLENQGGLKFECHELARFHGAYQTATVDLDGDGDLDIVVVSMMNEWNQDGRQSMIWLENDGSQRFTPRLLAHSPTSLATLAVGDLIGNGRPDILAGGLYVTDGLARAGRVTIWINLGRDGFP